MGECQEVGGLGAGGMGGGGLQCSHWLPCLPASPNFWECPSLGRPWVSGVLASFHLKLVLKGKRNLVFWEPGPLLLVLLLGVMSLSSLMGNTGGAHFSLTTRL